MAAQVRSLPLVSVGVPTYESAGSISATLNGLRAQQHQNLEILVTDNASTDDTAELCGEVARQDKRVHLERHQTNLGAQESFRRLLERSTGAFFMWAGSDDIHHPDFVSSNLERLLRDHSLAGSVSHVRWTQSGVPGELAPGTCPLLGPPRENLARYMRTARDNSRFYGLFRRNVLEASFPGRTLYGFDIAVMAGTLRMGGHDRVDRVLLSRERSDPKRYVRQVDSSAADFLDRLLPFRRLTTEILGQSAGILSPSAVMWLGARNAYEHFRYWGSLEGPYSLLAGRICSVLDRVRRVAWESEDSSKSTA